MKMFKNTDSTSEKVAQKMRGARGAHPWAVGRSAFRRAVLAAEGKATSPIAAAWLTSWNPCNEVEGSPRMTMDSRGAPTGQLNQ